jgi:methionyl-tRNA formyltransferase
MNEYIPELMLEWIKKGYEVRWAYDIAQIPDSDMCFYLNYGKIVPVDSLKKHQNNLVVHESDLPEGRGWSPLIWQILERKKLIPITVFEASEEVDSGQIYFQKWISFDGSELVDELRKKQAQTSIILCSTFVNTYFDVIRKARPEHGISTYYPRRTPKDSKIDLDKTIRKQINLLRVADNNRYPIWFELKGKKIALIIRESDLSRIQ